MYSDRCICIPLQFYADRFSLPPHPTGRSVGRTVWPATLSEQVAGHSGGAEGAESFNWPLGR